MRTKLVFKKIIYDKYPESPPLHLAPVPVRRRRRVAPVLGCPSAVSSSGAKCSGHTMHVCSSTWGHLHPGPGQTATVWAARVPSLGGGGAADRSRSSLCFRRSPAFYDQVPHVTCADALLPPSFSLASSSSSSSSTSMRRKKKKGGSSTSLTLRYCLLLVKLRWGYSCHLLYLWSHAYVCPQMTVN